MFQRKGAGGHRQDDTGSLALIRAFTIAAFIRSKSQPKGAVALTGDALRDLLSKLRTAQTAPSATLRTR
jgi:hypothetical protein